MIKFDSFDEIKQRYPLNTNFNQKFTVTISYEYCLTNIDYEIAKLHHPFGWKDKVEHKWCYYKIFQETWYDHYVFNGQYFFLGLDSWDGIYGADEPNWGIHKDMTKKEFGVFKTEEEAREYCNKKLKERLEF